MTKTLRAIFDGNVLRPEGSVDLQPNTWYVVTIEREAEAKTDEETYVSVNSFLDTFGPQIRLQQPRHNIAPVSPGQGLCSHAVQ